jgi:hypothetical protein
MDLGVDPAPNINEYQTYLWGKGGRCLGLKPLLPSFADCLEILGASATWSCEGKLYVLYVLAYTYFRLTDVNFGTQHPCFVPTLKEGNIGEK